KKWYGKAKEDKGHKQLAEYLEIKGADKGYMVMFNFRKRKKYTKEWIEVDGKHIYEVVV
ncbi:MAG TPA: AAA family ATPase, partial [Clostridiales bacterium]|nr:AAA family ATPase [Clostridiales bacterium]